jgi:2-succinyl-5-enolpyruvyl-6-hydroxy-3-cyclohexene-1-carboxylate synthase
MSNRAFAFKIIQALVDAGVQEFCICPGARNSPLAALLLELESVRVFHHFEERSAAFFVLGCIKRNRRPMAIITTSGTAAGELLPATMEAHYTSLPMVLLTADRPRSFRGSGAPQTAEQPGIYGVYAEKSLDITADEEFAFTDWSAKRPLHINACFVEPLIDPATHELTLDRASPDARLSQTNQTQMNASSERDDDVAQRLADFLIKTQHPLAIVSALSKEDQPQVREFLLKTGIPVYFEAQSGLREEASLAAQRVHVSDSLFERASAQGYDVDGVIRIGSVPTLRAWRDLEIKKIPVFLISREPFSGLSGLVTEAESIGPALDAFLKRAPLTPKSQASRFLQRDGEAMGEMEVLLEKYPRSEPALFRQLSERIPPSAQLFVGNSLPIREWDLAASFNRGVDTVGAARGLNGIDGQVSTFLGFCDPGQENWAILGDLTTLYDLSAPWILEQLSPEMRATLVIINNQGGKIFSRMFKQREFQNQHTIEFSSWAKMWSLPYEKWETVLDTVSHAPLRIVELKPEQTQTDLFWKELEPVWKK